MLPKNGHSVEKKYFLYSIIKIYDVNYYLKHRKNIFCNLTIFELVNAIEDFESLCIGLNLKCFPGSNLKIPWFENSMGHTVRNLYSIGNAASSSIAQ